LPSVAVAPLPALAAVTVSFDVIYGWTAQ